MAFCFNFGEPESSNLEKDAGTHLSIATVPTTIAADANHVLLEKRHMEMVEDSNCQSDSYQFSDIVIKYIQTSVIENNLISKDSALIKETIAAHSDLIPGVYEGGLKIWECSLDLIDFIVNEKIKFEGINVLEIGCGAGLPGIYVYLKGGNVTFQDYNSEVLNYVTIPNVLLNTEKQPKENFVASKCNFISGDWSKVTPLLQFKRDQKFDIILTSETIYSLESQKKLLKLIKDVLHINGVVYLAAKTFYFGVGGGTREFEDLVLEDGHLTSSVVHFINEGVQREVLRLKFK